MPAPYPALGVSGLKGPWQFERMGLTIRSARSDTRGQTYTVESIEIRRLPTRCASWSPGSGRRSSRTLNCRLHAIGHRRDGA